MSPRSCDGGEDHCGITSFGGGGAGCGVRRSGRPVWRRWWRPSHSTSRYRLRRSSADGAGNGVGEPTMLLPALAMVTTSIGLVTTASTTYNEPYNIARR